MTVESPADSISLIEILRSVRKSPLYFFIWFVLLFGLVVAAYFLAPRQYLSDGKLFVQVGRSSVGTDPTTSSSTISLQDSRETEVKSVVAMLESREIAGLVADRVGVERILEPVSTIGKLLDSLPAIELSSGAPGGDSELTSEEIEKIKRRNLAIKELLGEVEVEHGKKTTVITVAVSLQTPFLARDVINAYLYEYQKKHVEINRRSASDNFFSKQFVHFDEQLAQAEEALQDFRDSLGSLTVEGARSLLQQEINQLSLDRVSTSIEYSQAREKADQFLNQLIEIPKLIKGADTQVASFARGKAREALFNLQLLETEMSAKLADLNPKLIEIRDAIKKAKKDIEEIPETFNEAEQNINVVHQQVLVLHAEADARAKSLQERLQQIELAIGAKQKEVKKLNQAETKRNAMQRKIQIAKQSLMQMASKRAESRTIGALDSEQISNVRVAQKASLIIKKVFPSGAVFGVLGLAFAFFGATVMTFFKHNKIWFDVPSETTPVPEDSGLADREAMLDGFEDDVPLRAQGEPESSRF